jgi:hypothetical protein
MKTFPVGPFVFLLLSSCITTSEAGESFNQRFKLQGISFHVTCPNNSSINTVRIVPAGLTIDNSTIVKDVDGTVVGAEIADINADGSPEIYIYATSAGSGSYGSLIAYAANQNKSLSEIYLPAVNDNEKQAKGYMGHDAFAVGEGALLHRFPIYREGDTNANPTGGMRQIQYRLVRGEAGWILKAYHEIEY